MPKVSIIVPVYNTEKYLRTCLDSIMAQTFTDFEAILVDDGSTDSSGIICDEYATKDNRFVVVHKQNEGVAKARITAFEHSKGDLITFIDADDYVSSDYLEKLSRPIAENGADMVSCNYNNVVNGKCIPDRDRASGEYSGDKLQDFISNHFFYDKDLRSFSMNWLLWTKMIKREFVEPALLCGKGLWFGEDQVAVFYILYHIKRLYLIPDRLYYYMHYEGQATSIYKKDLWANICDMLEKYMAIDVKGIEKDGLRRRTWFYINLTISKKMRKAQLSRNDFCSDLSVMRNHPYMKRFFIPFSLGTNQGWRNMAKYLILKFRLYWVMYWLVYKKSI